MDSILVLIPTYNEIENLPKMVKTILSMYSENFHILIVDDNSPDGTGEWATKYSEKEVRVQSIIRTGKKGRGLASKEGYSFFLESKFDWLIEIDTDFSHNPSDIKRMLEFTSNADLVVGSRYIDGGGFGNYPFHRILLSTFTNSIFRILLGIKTKDSTQSFMLMSKKVFKIISPKILNAEGFAIFLEIKFHVQRAGMKILEIPIKIKDRDLGETKMNFLQAISVLKLFYDLIIKKKYKI